MDITETKMMKNNRYTDTKHVNAIATLEKLHNFENIAYAASQAQRDKIIGLFFDNLIFAMKRNAYSYVYRQIQLINEIFGGTDNDKK